MTTLPQVTAPRRSLRDRLMVVGIAFVAPAAIISAVSYGVTTGLSAASHSTHVATTHVAGAKH